MLYASIYRYKVSSRHSLYIRETKVEDSGEYLCIASNIAGKRSAAAYLTVINTTLLNGEWILASEWGVKEVKHCIQRKGKFLVHVAIEWAISKRKSREEWMGEAPCMYFAQLVYKLERGRLYLAAIHTKQLQSLFMLHHPFKILSNNAEFFIQLHYWLYLRIQETKPSLSERSTPLNAVLCSACLRVSLQLKPLSLFSLTSGRYLHQDRSGVGTLYFITH